jgi:hypothetical protein
VRTTQFQADFGNGEAKDRPGQVAPAVRVGALAHAACRLLMALELRGRNQFKSTSSTPASISTSSPAELTAKTTPRAGPVSALTGGERAGQDTESLVEVDVADKLELDVYHRPHSFALKVQPNGQKRVFSGGLF